MTAQDQGGARHLPCSSCGYHFGHTMWCANNPKNAGPAPAASPADEGQAGEVETLGFIGPLAANDWRCVACGNDGNDSTLHKPDCPTLDSPAQCDPDENADWHPVPDKDDSLAGWTFADGVNADHVGRVLHVDPGWLAAGYVSAAEVERLVAEAKVAALREAADRLEIEDAGGFNSYTHAVWLRARADSHDTGSERGKS